MHLVTLVQFPSCDKDGGHTLQYTTVKNNMLHADFMTLCYIQPQLWPIEFLHFGNTTFYYFLLWPWPSCTNWSCIPCTCNRGGIMNFLRQDFWNLSSDRHTQRQTDRQTDKNSSIPCRIAGDRNANIWDYISSCKHVFFHVLPQLIADDRCESVLSRVKVYWQCNLDHCNSRPVTGNLSFCSIQRLASLVCINMCRNGILFVIHCILLF